MKIMHSLTSISLVACFLGLPCMTSAEEAAGEHDNPTSVLPEETARERAVSEQIYQPPLIRGNSGIYRWVDSCANLFGVITCEHHARAKAALAFCQREGGFGYGAWEESCPIGGDTFRYKESVRGGQVVREWEWCPGCTCHFTKLVCLF